MVPLTLMDIDRAVRAAWALDTCDPDDVGQWHPGNPARGQCGVTALVVQDLLGGELMLGEVRVAGERTGLHWWNRFTVGVEIDLTREQFGPQETVTIGEPVGRPPGPPRRCREQYELLHARVITQLRQGTAVQSPVRA